MRKWKIAVAVIAITMTGVPVCAANAVGTQNVQQEFVLQDTAANAETERNVVSQEEEGISKTAEVNGKQTRSLGDEGEISQISLIAPPDQTEYYGEVDRFDLTGAKILVKYEDGEEKELTSDGNFIWKDKEENEYVLHEEYIGAYRDNGEDYAYGEQKIKISLFYNRGIYTETTIYVHEIEISKLEILSFSNIDFCEGYNAENLFVPGMKVRLKVLLDGKQEYMKEIVYEDETKKDLNGDWIYKVGWYDTDGEECPEYLCPKIRYCGEYKTYDYQDDNFKTEQGFAPGKQKVKIVVGEKEEKFEINVKEIESITIIGLDMENGLVDKDSIVLYGENDHFSIEGKSTRVKVLFKDGSSKIVSGNGVGSNVKDDQGVLQNMYFHEIYRGKYMTSETGEKLGFFEYGTWPVERNLAGKKAFYNITVKPCEFNDCGKIETEKELQCTMSRKKKNKFTFTPDTTGTYALKLTQDTDASFLYSIKRGKVALFIGQAEWLLKAGTTYTFEFTLPWYEKDHTLKFKITKTGEEKIIKVPASFIASFEKENHEQKVYTFVPDVSGTYCFRTENQDENDGCYITLWDEDMNNIYQWGSEWIDEKVRENSYYLQKGQTYVYSVEGYSKGNVRITLNQKAEDHAHQWVNSENGKTEPTCVTLGKQDQTCSICGLGTSIIFPRKAHTFGDYTITNKPTVFAEGSKMRTCSVCDYVEHTVIPKLPAIIKVNVKNITLKTGQSTSAVKVSNLTAGDSIVSWKSNKTQIAKVTNSGKITAGKKTGTATITVTLKSGVTAKIKVKVQKKPIAVKKIKVDKKNVTLQKKKSCKINVELQPITVSDKVKFVSSNRKVATVNAKGVIKAKKAGTAKITVRAGKKQTVVKVKVK